MNSFKGGTLLEGQGVRKVNQVVINPYALGMAKTLWSFGKSECNNVKDSQKYSHQRIGEFVECLYSGIVLYFKTSVWRLKGIEN